MASDEAIPAKEPRRTRQKWSATRRAAFFDHLSIAGNITQAAAAVGVKPGSVHELRSRDTAFADAWEAAIEAGYATIEMRLIGHVLAGLGQNDPLVPVGEGPAIDMDCAIRLLRERDTRRTGARSSRGAAKLRRATEEETDAAILSRIAVIAARKSQG